MEKKKHGRQDGSREVGWESYTVQVEDDLAWLRMVPEVDMVRGRVHALEAKRSGLAMWGYRLSR